MSIKVGFNGFGRIGKLAFQGCYKRSFYNSRLHGIYGKI